MTKLQELRQKLANAERAYKSFLAEPNAPAGGTAEFEARCNELEDSIGEITAQISREERRSKLEGARQMRVAVSGGEDVIERSPTHGFESFGEFALAVVHAGRREGPITDERLRIGADAPGSTTVNTAAGSEGGFLIPPEYSTTIREFMFNQQSLLPLCSVDRVNGNTLTFPVDLTTPWGGTGVQAYWEGEGANITRSALVTEAVTLRLKKLAALVPVTDEMIADASVLGTRLPRLTGRAIDWETNDVIINGSGAGRPLGIRNALNAALLSQAAEGSQTADTINAANVSKMLARNTNVANVTWLLHPDSFNQLPQMVIGDQPVWLPATGVQGVPGGTLFGRPLLLSDTCQTLGDAGDILAIDFAAYDVITKAGGVEFASSMHLWFDYDMTAFRAIFRVDGRPAFRTYVTPPYSSVTRSPYVQLAART